MALGTTWSKSEKDKLLEEEMLMEQARIAQAAPPNVNPMAMTAPNPGVFGPMVPPSAFTDYMGRTQIQPMAAAEATPQFSDLKKIKAAMQGRNKDKNTAYSSILDAKKTQNNLLYDEEEVKKADDFARSRPEYVAAEQGIALQQAEIDRLKNSPDSVEGKPEWLRALAAYSDAINPGQNQYASMKPITSQKDKQKEITALTKELQGSKENLVKLLGSNLSGMKGAGYTGTYLTNRDGTSVASGGGSGAVDPVFSKMVMTQHQQNMLKINGDKGLQDLRNKYYTLDNALNNITNSSHLTSQLIHEAQQAIRTTLFSGGSRSGVGEREKTYMESAGISLDNAWQWATGKPADVGTNDEIVQHLLELAEGLKKNFGQQFEQELATKGGARWMYEMPEYSFLQKDLTSGAQRLKDSMKTVPNTQKGLNKVGGPGAKGVKSTAPKVNPVTGHSDDDIDAELKRRGLKK